MNIYSNYYNYQINRFSNYIIINPLNKSLSQEDICIEAKKDYCKYIKQEYRNFILRRIIEFNKKQMKKDCQRKYYIKKYNYFVNNKVNRQ